MSNWEGMKHARNVEKLHLQIKHKILRHISNLRETMEDKVVQVEHDYYDVDTILWFAKAIVHRSKRPV